MSIFSNEDYLPGVVTEIESVYANDYDTSLFGTTDSVVVIGTAFDGPTGEIVPIYSTTHAAYLYGKSYDAITRKETDLVAGIKDVWDQGCRTIYGFRINGKEMYKDFKFAIDTDYKLRIRSRYPSNLGKQVYLKFDNTRGAETITIYKPAVRSTIREKMNGLVESDIAVMVNELRLGTDYAFTRDSKLVDIIDIVNNHVYNNVLEMAIIDGDGNDVTNSPEAYDITLGCMFPGVYFMGRSESACTKRTNVATNIIMSDTDTKPFTNFGGNYYQDLTFNSDVASEYPIYYKPSDVAKMREVLLTAGVTMKEPDDYLTTAGVSERAFLDDEIDYEEVSMTPFEIYQRLGEGYAITAIAERRVDGSGNEILPKIKEAPLDDPLRIQPIGDGGYSTLQDAKIKYRVLGSGICADQEIGGKVPKASAFKTTVVNSTDLMNGLISVTPKVGEDEATAAKSYTFSMANYDIQANPIALTSENLYTDNIAEDVGFSDSVETILAMNNATPGKPIVVSTTTTTTTTEGEDENAHEVTTSETSYKLYVANAKGKFTDNVDKNYAGSHIGAGNVVEYGGKLYAANNKLFKASVSGANVVLTEVDPAEDLDSKTYVLVNSIGKLFVEEVGSGAALTPLCEFDEAMNISKDEDAEIGLLVFVQSNEVGDNTVQIKGVDFASLNLTDFVERLNESVLGRIFEFKLTPAGIILKDEYVADTVDPSDPTHVVAGADTQAKTSAINSGNTSAQSMLADGATVTLEADRTRGYDYTKHIPYYTTDNFMRQLAQHCTYTELKTGPARGVIGFKRVTDLSKPNLAKKVAELKARNWDLYAKTYYGRNMLDNNNLPYPIGRNVSAVFTQNRVTTPSDYVQVCNGATAYAGMVSALPLEQSSTAQPIDIVPMFELTHSQLATLTAAGIVSVRSSFTRGFVITDGITMAPSDDLLKRLFNTRVMGYVEDLLRAACEPFIGKANSSANRNSLNTAVDSALSRITENRNANDGTALLLSYDFNLVDDATAEQYTYIDIYYNIRPMNEIRNIYNHIRVTR